MSDDLPVDTLLYTTSVVNTPSGVRNDISLARERVMSIVIDPIRREALRASPSPEEPLIPEVVASLMRMTGGNFRLLARLLTQIERVLSVNDLHFVSNAVVEAARDSLVIGPG